MRITKSLLVIGLCLAFAAPALAQMGGGQGMGGPGQGPGMGPGRGRGMMYNPQTVTTIQGTAVSQGPQKGRRMQHVSWIIRTAQGDLTVHLGPSTYLNQQQLVINPGDAIEVTGSQLQMRGKTMLVAKEVKVGGRTFEIRDDQGLPLWRGQGRPQPQ